MMKPRKKSKMTPANEIPPAFQRIPIIPPVFVPKRVLPSNQASVLLKTDSGFVLKIEDSALERKTGGIIGIPLEAGGISLAGVILDFPRFHHLKKPI